MVPDERGNIQKVNQEKEGFYLENYNLKLSDLQKYFRFRQSDFLLRLMQQRLIFFFRSAQLAYTFIEVHLFT